MSFFTKYRLIAWILGGLLVVTLSFSGTILYHYLWDPTAAEEISTFNSPRILLQQELGMEEDQKLRLERIFEDENQRSRILVDSMRKTRSCFISELNQPDPDTLTLDSLAREIGYIQMEMTRQMARQYRQIHAICTPGQRERLQYIYCDFLGCPRMSGKAMDRPERQYRHRHQYGKRNRTGSQNQSE